MPQVNNGVAKVTMTAQRSIESPNSSTDSERSPSSGHRAGATITNSNLYVGGLHDSVRDADLAHRFQLFGKVVSAKVMLHIHTGQSRGIGFVKFETHESALAAIQALHRSMFHGQRIMVRFADSRADFRPGDKTSKVFVRNLPFDVSLTALRNYFTLFGPIQDCTLHLDTAGFKSGGSGVRTRMAYITFDSVEHAETAATSVHGTRPFPTCHAAVMAKLAESDTKRQERRQQIRERVRETDNDASTPTEEKKRDNSSNTPSDTCNAVNRSPLSPNEMPTSGSSHGSNNGLGGSHPSQDTSDPNSSDSSDNRSSDGITRESPGAASFSRSHGNAVRPPVGPIRIPLPAASPTFSLSGQSTSTSATASSPAPPRRELSQSVQHTPVQATPTHTVAPLAMQMQMPPTPLTAPSALPLGYPYTSFAYTPNPTAAMFASPTYLPGYPLGGYAGLPTSVSAYPTAVASAMPSLYTTASVQPLPPVFASYPGYTTNPYAPIMPTGLPAYPTPLPQMPLRWP